MPQIVIFPAVVGGFDLPRRVPDDVAPAASFSAEIAGGPVPPGATAVSAAGPAASLLLPSDAVDSRGAAAAAAAGWTATAVGGTGAALGEVAGIASVTSGSSSGSSSSLLRFSSDIKGVLCARVAAKDGGGGWRLSTVRCPLPTYA